MTVVIEEAMKARVEEYAQRLLEEGLANDPDHARERAVDEYKHVIAVRDKRWETVPRRFRTARVEDLDGAIGEAVAEWRNEPWRNLILLGSVGTGKTHAAVAALRLAVEQGHRIAFYPVVELLDAMRPHGDPDAYERCESTDYLVLDDLGAERPTDWTAERLYALVNRRWLEGLSTIVTSNLSASNGKGPFVDAVGTRMYSRLVHDAVVAQAAGADRRRAS